MKRIALFFMCLTAVTTWAAQPGSLEKVLPLLQAPSRNAAQNQQVLQLFTTAKDPNMIFSTGASLVRLPPAQVQQAKLLNVLLREDNQLRKVFAAVILVAMGNMYEELSPVLEQALESHDEALRAYAASAYTILHAPNDTHLEEVVQLYIYDPAFAQRAMNLISDSEQETLQKLKSAAGSYEARVRAAAATWLGDLQTQEAAKQLVKMAKKEKDAAVSASLAGALAKNREWTLEEVAKELQESPKKRAAATFALALGYMTGHAVDAIKQGLQNSHAKVRINAARAAAYMAGVLASKEAALYTQDKAFDTELLKSLIPLLAQRAQQGSSEEKTYAQNALTQISKLK